MTYMKYSLLIDSAMQSTGSMVSEKMNKAPQMFIHPHPTPNH